MELFEKAGYFCEELKDKKSRKLIFTNEEQKLRFFLSKGPDVPTYVEYGAADIGIVGSDIILEEQRRCHEVLDLGFGKCRMCVAGPPEAEELLRKAIASAVAVFRVLDGEIVLTDIEIGGKPIISAVREN
jgi:ATP phosphoribosyltransferase